MNSPNTNPLKDSQEDFRREISINHSSSSKQDPWLLLVILTSEELLKPEHMLPKLLDTLPLVSTMNLL